MAVRIPYGADFKGRVYDVLWRLLHEARHRTIPPRFQINAESLHKKFMVLAIQL